MSDSSNWSNLRKWTYNFLLRSHYSIHGVWPRGEKPIPNILLSPADLTDDPVRKKELKAELVEINKRRALGGC